MGRCAATGKPEAPRHGPRSHHRAEVLKAALPLWQKRVLAGAIMDHETADLSMPQAPEEELGLSAAALAALAEFALDNGILAEADADSSIRQQVQSHFEALEPEKEELFTFEYGHVRLTMEGWRRDLGQTLSSTGLTVWSGAEDLAAYLWRHRAVLFPEKSQKVGSASCFVLPGLSDAPSGHQVVVELGAGLGLPGILCGAIMALASDSGTVICTDGDDNSLEKLRRNVEINGELLGAVQTEVLRLRWGQDLRVLDEALERLHGEDGRAVDLIIAADVIYQVRLSTCPTQLLDAPARCLHEGYGG
eukprot:scaffold368_cov258-Pinguiococcus_pyrenoidosus.AAC.20